MKLLTALCFISLLSFPLFSQESRLPIYVNAGIDTSNVEIAEVVSLWLNYLRSHPDSLYDNPYWNQAEKQSYKNFDFLSAGYFSPSLYYFLPSWKATVMSVAKADSHYVIRTLFATQTESGFAKPFCIALTAAIKEDSSYKVCNILPFNTRTWRHEQVGSITFIFDETHQFNADLAKRLNSFVDSLAALWNLKPVPIDFYLMESMPAIMKMRGFDFYIGEGYNTGPGGVTDIVNHIVFGAGQNEWYPHEFVHVYINPLYPHAHHYFLEGYATLLGGSKGQDLRWHMQRMNRHLKEHPEIDLNSLLDFWHFDAVTNPQLVFGGLFCQLAIERGGLAELKQLMSYDSDDFYIAIEKEFGVGKKDLNRFVREKLNAYASQ